MTLSVHCTSYFFSSLHDRQIVVFKLWFLCGLNTQDNSQLLYMSDGSYINTIFAAKVLFGHCQSNLIQPHPHNPDEAN